MVSFFFFLSDCFLFLFFQKMDSSSAFRRPSLTSDGTFSDVTAPAAAPPPATTVPEPESSTVAPPAAKRVHAEPATTPTAAAATTQRFVPDSERNALAARALRAKLAGNTALYAKLQARLAASAPPPPPPVARVEVDPCRVRRTPRDKEDHESHSRGSERVPKGAQPKACSLCAGAGVLALAPHSRLALPPGAPLVDGHCAIVPREHVGSLRDADEAVLREVARFKAALAAMFRAQGRGCVFMETVLPRSGHSTAPHHTFVDVVPLDAAHAADAPVVFHEALVACEDELAQQHGVLTPRGRALAQCVPAGFPYFHVEFVLPGPAPDPEAPAAPAFVRVIEDARRYSRDFGRTVVAGLLDLPPGTVHAPHPPPAEMQAAAARLADAFAPYDWTSVEQEGGGGEKQSEEKERC